MITRFQAYDVTVTPKVGMRVQAPPWGNRHVPSGMLGTITRVVSPWHRVSWGRSRVFLHGIRVRLDTGKHLPLAPSSQWTLGYNPDWECYESF